ncbi:MAG: tRNA preQ1(34) S-adenosylmethionine ribosyltransferase-isomerase QueA [Elusimicrobia bacterium]|nr:tRNA preQ1(34) S-adenosylmethionine ribosyltransferase-isomerase QueA [Elusimicrobiota bacterium]
MSEGPPRLPRSEYDFPFPEELVAAEPSAQRDSSRLMTLDRRTGAIGHHLFKDIVSLLSPGDTVVLNRSKVVPCRLAGKKPTGGAAELLLVREASPGVWHCLGTGVKPGVTVQLGGATAEAVGRLSDGLWEVRFSSQDVRGLLEKVGLPPLPPYIRSRRKKAGLADAVPSDMGRYQTVYAREDGSLAAPTAGLHYTDTVLAALRNKGVSVVEIVLHVGLGTFKPIVAEDCAEHEMLPETYEVSLHAADTIARTSGRVVAVGTTATRTLETVFSGGVKAGPKAALKGQTFLYITPGYEFRAVDVLQTNFHQPASTPLLLACAFAGKERVFAAYQEAIARKYRLFSYGDAMLVT